MDDYNLATLSETKNELVARLVSILSPRVIEGFHSMLTESLNICKKTKEPEKYLMTMQNLINRIHQWNSQTVTEETKRIVEKSQVDYLADLITCVHVVKLKALSAIRVGQKQKKIDITIPKLDQFIHKVYITTGREIFKNVFLFERGLKPLLTQQNNRHIELIVQMGILNTVRESIPVEALLKAYMYDEEVVEEVVEEKIMPCEPEKPPEVLPPSPSSPSPSSPIPSSPSPSSPIPSSPSPSSPSNPSPPPTTTTRLSFSDIDYVQRYDGSEQQVVAPKSIESVQNQRERGDEWRRKMEGEGDGEDDSEKITFMDTPIVPLSLDELPAVSGMLEELPALLPELLSSD
jgi:hypothetical protein